MDSWGTFVPSSGPVCPTRRHALAGAVIQCSLALAMNSAVLPDPGKSRSAIALLLERVPGPRALRSRESDPVDLYSLPDTVRRAPGGPWRSAHPSLIASLTLVHGSP
jgi:hypothetical protein